MTAGHRGRGEAKELMMGQIGRVRAGRFVLVALSLMLAAAALASAATAQTFPRSGLLISELRFAGPSGVHDGYVDLFNPAASTVQVDGLKLVYAALAGATTQTVTLPSGATIRPYGHYLVADSAYSLSSTASADDTVSLTLPPVGVKLTNADGSVVDAVGETGAPTGFYSGTPLTAPLVNGQTAFVRRGSGIALANAGNNQADFDFVATDAHTTTYGVAAEQGAPDPMNTSSLDQIDPYVNTVQNGRSPTYDASTKTLTIYRSIENTSSLFPKTRLVFTHLTTYGSPGAGSKQAVLLAQSSPAAVYYYTHIAYYPGDRTVGDPSHCGLSDPTTHMTPFCDTASSPSTLQPPSPAGQGGVNSALSMPAAAPTWDTPESGYGAGVYEYVALQFHVPQGGKYSASWNLYTSPVPTVAVSPKQGHPSADFRTGAPTPLTVTGGNWPVGDHVEVLIGGSGVCNLIADSLGNLVSRPSDDCTVPDFLTAGAQPLTADDDLNGGTGKLMAKGPNFKMTPILYLDPSDGTQKPPNVSAGNPMYEFVGGFAANSSLSFTMDGHPITTSPAALTTNSQGTQDYVGDQIIVPAGTKAGQHTVTATDGDGNAASFTIHVYDTSISLTPTSGQPKAPYGANGSGTQFTVSGSGWPAGDPVSVRIGTYDGDGKLSCLLYADNSGNISATAASDTCSLPELPAGSQRVEAADGFNPAVYSSGTPINVLPVLQTGGGTQGGSPEVSPGNHLYVTAAGFAANSAMTFKLDGNTIGLDGTSHTTDDSGTLNEDSGFNPYSFTVPANETAGNHTVEGTDAGGNSATSTFRVFRPTLAISPNHGVAGASLTVTGSGWPATDRITVYIGANSNGIPSAACSLFADDSGNIASTGQCAVPSDVASGSQPVKGVDYDDTAVTAFTGPTSFTVGS